MADTVLITTRDLEPAIRVRDAFVAEGYEVELLTAGERIRDVADPVLVILTGALEEKQARRLAREAFELDRLPVIGLFEDAADASLDARRRLGLAAALVKPVDPRDAALLGKRLIDRRHLRAVTGIIGETEPMIEVLERVAQMAPVTSTVLVTGESGTGKERVARGIHALSLRKNRPFIAANVAALPETLLESELFGHERGAFTGATGQRKGFFELAHKGTLFLDEIGELPQATQIKLLRVLEEREFMRLGGEEPIRVDVRVIAATNQELRQQVELGRFRRDLYYRLNVLHVAVPPLRGRQEDIPLLVEHFVGESARDLNRPAIAVSADAMRVLREYDWPGNVRELRNVIESLVVLAPGTVVQAEDLPREIRSRTGRSGLPAPLHRFDPPGDSSAAPELEFIFRTLIQLKMDVEEMRSRFEEHRDRHADLGAGTDLGMALNPPGVVRPSAVVTHGTAIEDVEYAEADADEEEVIVYRPGMTMSEIERAVITATLRDLKGNRRKAAESLGIGERTLYRKIKEYGIPL